MAIARYFSPKIDIFHKIFYELVSQRKEDTGVRGLMRGLVTLLPEALVVRDRDGSLSGQRQGWKTPRGPSGSALLLCV